MVQIQVKQDEEKQFLYHCLSTTGVNEIAKDVIEIANLQTRTQRFVLALEPRLLQLGVAGGYLNAASIPLRRALSEAKTYASKDQVLNKKPLSPHVLKDHIQAIEREVMVNQSLDLSDSTQLQQLFSGSSSDLKLMQEDTTQLWWAGKELMRNKRLCDYIGENEKTKIMIRLQLPASDPGHSMIAVTSSSNECRPTERAQG
ncbi:PREDICTED: UPF0769 protein C21orf59 homolog [Nelumbo nucifera]|uniref:UPF0769 protein C21orf59 homolog n=2 Tax=Nelumbo nucifera TaxID=4432 RepID=A0A1U7ZWA5_NELNU|nr:PREDICTED: UPF0769 protein C21orf59 homolog [Nelumbo nucifera]DAD25966.1 TPA_asm: hypothetical protein HUJ06_027434 [Nelumbo nucifera]